MNERINTFIKTLEQIITDNGACINVKCDVCPFHFYSGTCGESGFVSLGSNFKKPDKKLIRSAKKWIEENRHTRNR